MIVLQLNEGQDPGSSANKAYEIINRKYEDQVKGQPYVTAEFARDESRTIFTVGDGKYYTRSSMTEFEADRKRKDMSGELTPDNINTLCKECPLTVARAVGVGGGGVDWVVAASPRLY